MFAAVATEPGTLETEDIEPYLDDVAVELREFIPKEYRPDPEVESALEGDAKREAARRLRAKVSRKEHATILDAGEFSSTRLGARVTRWMRKLERPPS